jgi:hypothetical protein
MAAKRKRWNDLTKRRRLIVAGAVGEGILKVVALIDIKRRPATQIRGPKWLWATVMRSSALRGSCRSHISSLGGERLHRGLTWPSVRSPASRG